MRIERELTMGPVFASASRPKPQSRDVVLRPARRSDGALVDALTIIVHDLRGPLANLQVMLELIEVYSRSRTFAEAAGCAQRAQEMIQSLNEMLGGFLERARTTGDPLAYRPVLMDLGEACDRALALNRPLAENRAITIERLGTTPVTLEADPRLLVEAIDNVLGNAIKYSPAGSSIGCICGIEGDSAVVKIVDAGPGFSDAELGALFKPFTRLGTRKPARGPSTGLGLWIARLVATRHGGSLTVARRQDRQGSIFTLRLPARPPQGRRANGDRRHAPTVPSIRQITTR